MDVEALVLERVGELVGEGHVVELAAGRRRSAHDRELLASCVVVARDLLAVDRGLDPPQVGPVRNQAEELEELLVRAQDAGRARPVELGEALAPRLGRGHEPRLRDAVEAQAADRLDAAGDGGDAPGGVDRRDRGARSGSVVRRGLRAGPRRRSPAAAGEPHGDEDGREPPHGEPL